MLWIETHPIFPKLFHYKTYHNLIILSLIVTTITLSVFLLLTNDAALNQKFHIFTFCHKYQETSHLIQQLKRKNNMRNMFKVNSKGTRTRSLPSFWFLHWSIFGTLFWCFYCWLSTCNCWRDLSKVSKNQNCSKIWKSRVSGHSMEILYYVHGYLKGL